MSLAGELSREIAALFDLSVSELKDRWRSVYGTKPPPRSSGKLLTSAIAYRWMRQSGANSSLELKFPDLWENTGNLCE
jgi:hypothetical protein